MLGEHLAHPTEQPAGRFHARARDDGQEDQQLTGAEMARRTRLVLELDGQQLGDQVIGRVLLAPLDVVAEHIAVEVVVLVDRQRLTRLVAQHPMRLGPHRRLIGIGNADEHADGLHR